MSVEDKAFAFVEACVWEHLDPVQAISILHDAWHAVLDKEKRMVDYGFKEAKK